ncbi:Putative sodium-dependent excitatory amino acid transporter glt-4 [Caenorhabditis elegans]|uniref:Putative sodium-dependent excitatory amino acid transporter glt-4 n=1 Tax=Caenorhabditis elegans TaxID=6239 RepID=EAA4_CAEEL|nr:Putative sodium-dependent excitatory amino acid transporter glt-4 [Caenorhabditis elegans]Q22682.3 RecName: Full=Putative sodium-dependent excitatory amino acid transporter glt-4 [Caenorhabditis elegans]CCD72844.1 Putative sodium-dependent excitatory amino acid transporter glt-4 [Caenorhabditis elegans]|eukprot:NP_509075.3 Putative sodium-dependent excitatory amino acid transporter glt-4 [Caenorhabditis elegans]
MAKLSKENLLLLFTVLGVVVGIGLGFSLRDPSKAWSKRHLSYLRFPGDLFVQMLKMLILPMIMSSIITSLASLDSGTAGRLGMVSMIYYTLTTFFAVFLGIVLVSVIKPGKWTTTNIEDLVGHVKTTPCVATAVDTIIDLMKSCFPENLIEATFRSQKICLKFFNGTTEIPPEIAMTMSPEQRAQFTEVPEKIVSDGMNILGLVVFSVALGIVIGVIGEDGKPMKNFFKSLEACSMKLIGWVIIYSPVGITFLIAAQIVGMKDPGQELHRLMGYVITVILGLLIHAFVVIPLLCVVLARRNPIKFVGGMAQALLTALATSSSSATLPLSIKCCEENNKVDPRVTRFVLPLGATINMDGTALYEAVAAIYISQCYGNDLSLGEVVLVSLTATLASIGAAGIPQAGIVTMIMVLIAIGLPTNLFILIFPVDFMLDRLRTTVNVHGDSIATAVIERLCEDQLQKGGHHLDTNDQGYSMLSTNASPDPKRITIGNNCENSHML